MRRYLHVIQTAVSFVLLDIEKIYIEKYGQYYNLMTNLAGFATHILTCSHIHCLVSPGISGSDLFLTSCGTSPATQVCLHSFPLDVGMKILLGDAGSS